MDGCSSHRKPENVAYNKPEIVETGSELSGGLPNSFLYYSANMDLNQSRCLDPHYLLSDKKDDRLVNVVRRFYAAKSEIHTYKPDEYQKPTDYNDLKELEPLDLIRKTFVDISTKDGHLCVYCGKLYSRKYGLKIHLRTHTGYKPLKCRHCQRSFGDPSNLNKHIRLHARTAAPYRCSVCDTVHVRRRDLKRHLRARHPEMTSNEHCDYELDVTT